MNQAAIEKRNTSSEAHWWKASRSLSEIADYLEQALRDKAALQYRLVDLLEENERLHLRCSRTAEPNRPVTETGLAASALSTGKGIDEKFEVAGWQKAALAAREKLIRDEFERKTQLLQVELNRERHALAKRMEQLEQEMSGCICREFRVEPVDRPVAAVAKSRPSKAGRFR